MSAGVVPEGEGNEAGGEGQQGVRAARSTAEDGELAPGDPAEGRCCRTTEPSKGKTKGRPSPVPVSTRLRRIAELARGAPSMAFTSLSQHIDVPLLREAFARTRRDGAPGVDGQTADHYQRDLEANLHALLDRLKSGTYRAPNVRRVHIPKGDGSKTRPIGIPTFEDKVLQRAVHMLLEPIYEQDFLDCSYGYRPGRSPQHALNAIWSALMDLQDGWVLEADIQGFFDHLDHAHLRTFLDRRVRDGVLRRVIHKWLKAGVLESGQVTYPDAGTPQGGVISPLLANVYLHEVLDTWFAEQVRPRLQGRAVLVRFADDFVIVFSNEADARRVEAVLPKRFGRFGLMLHPEKTRLLPFRRPPRNGREAPGARPHFDFLGFTHHWRKSRKGQWVVGQKTTSSRLTRALRAVSDWCRRFRHSKVARQHAVLSSKLRGHYAYYGRTGNGYALKSYWWQVGRVWRKWLDRRSRKAGMDWERFNRLLKRYPLPPPVMAQSVYRAQRTRSPRSRMR